MNFEDDFALEKARIDEYTGEININDAKSFIDNYALPLKTYLNIGETKSKNDVSSFFKIISKNDYKQFLIKNKNRNVIFLLNNDTEIPKYLIDFAYLTQ